MAITTLSMARNDSMTVTTALYPMQALTVAVLVSIIAIDTIMHLQLIYNATSSQLSPNKGSSINNSISMNHHINNNMQSFPTSTIYSAYSNPTSGLPMLYNPIINASLYPSSMSTIPVSSAIQPPLPPGPQPSIHHHYQHHQHYQQHQPMRSSSCPTPQYKYKPLFYKKL